MVKRVALALIIFVAASSRAQPRPSFSAMPGGVVAIALPQSVLQDATVRKQLGSGLTTTFLIVAKERATNNAGSARIEIRYDLWDDVWIVRKVEFDRKVDAQRIASFDALTNWWHNVVRLFASSGDRVSLDVELSVLPFSAAEQKDAREWISKSGGVGTSSRGTGSIVDALIGTTIAARPITSYRWRVDLPLK